MPRASMLMTWLRSQNGSTTGPKSRSKRPRCGWVRRIKNKSTGTKTLRVVPGGSHHWLLPVVACGLQATCAFAAAPLGDAAPRSNSEYHWELPPGFPPPVVPADNPMSSAKVELGQRLFAERRLSVTGQYACISCHLPERAYTDGRPKALGALGDETRRSAMSLTNVAYNGAYTWGDSTAKTLELQMRQPLFNEHPVELGLTGHENQILQSLSSMKAIASSLRERTPTTRRLSPSITSSRPLPAMNEH